MEPITHHLAQVNIGRIRAPLDSPVMADFVAQLDAINALAEASPGFVWRLQGEGNDATSLRPFDDDFIIVNMSVWESLEDLRAYATKARTRLPCAAAASGSISSSVHLWRSGGLKPAIFRPLARPKSGCNSLRHTARPPTCSRSSSRLRRRSVCGKIAGGYGQGIVILPSCHLA